MSEPSRGEFARLALEHIRRERPTFTAVLDEEQFHIKMTGPDGEASLASLSNFYDEYLHAAPEKRRHVFDRVLKVVGRIDTKEGLDEVRVSLMPRIRPRRYFDVDSLKAAAAFPDAKVKACPYRPFAEHLGIALAVDRTDTIEYVMDPTQYDVPVSELEEIALVNLKRMKSAPLREYAPGLFVGSWNDDYAAERMLLPELFTSLNLQGDPVVFLPGAERIYVVGSLDDNALERAFALAVQRANEPRGLVAFPFVRAGDDWKAFLPATALGEELDALLAFYLAGIYEQTRDAFVATLEGDDPPFVANVIALGDGNGAIEATVATWSEGVHAYLPRTTHMAFIGGAFVPGGPSSPPLVPWADAVALVGDLIRQVPGVYPPRFEVKEFPGAATLAKLAERTIRGAGRGPQLARPAVAVEPAGGRRNWMLAVVLVVVAIAYFVFAKIL